MNNKFIAIEGIEGSGKTESCKIIYNILKNYGIKNILIVREPGGTSIAEKIRKIIISFNKNEKLNKKTELFLIYASRIQLVETIIKPALKKGYIVIGDRHDLSSLAYQGGGLGIDLNIIRTLKKIAIDNFSPSLTIYLDIDPIIGLQRIKSRKYLDRIENKDISFFINTRNSYLKLIKNNPKIVTINTSQKKSIVQNHLELIIKKWIKEQTVYNGIRG
ncbi:Thymidylate kinase [Buchnera aphidicola (Thelaxes suberi)]